MKARERLEKLIRLFHEGEVVEKIAIAEKHVEEYEKQKVLYKEQLETFMESVMDECKLCKRKVCEKCQCETCDLEAAIKEMHKILPEDSLQVAVICIMSGVDDSALFKHYKELTKALSEVDGAYSHIAQKMKQFLLDENAYFSRDEEEELIERFFS